MGSFVSSNVSIYSILNFVGKGKCSTSAVNGDSVCYPWRLELGPLPLPSYGLFLVGCP